MPEAKMRQPLAVRSQLPAYPNEGMTVDELERLVLAVNPDQHRIAYRIDGGLMLADEYHLNLSHPDATMVALEQHVRSLHPDVAYAVDRHRKCVCLLENPGDADARPA